MKTNKSDTWRVTSGEMDAAGTGCSRHASPVTRHPSCHTSRVTFHVSRFTFHSPAFTLIELLTVITVIGVLAALMFPVVGSIKRQQYIKNATAEMAKLETAIENYKSAYGFYPPDNPANPRVNQLYFELLGTTNTDNTPTYQSLDDPTLKLTQTDLNNAFSLSVNGFMNCTKPGSGEDAPVARNFLPGLKPDQVVVYTNNFPNNTARIKLLVTSVGGPDSTYQPLGAGAIGINPWRYNSSNPTNNPGAYDLWIQLSISGRTNLICNWNNKVQFNSPLP